MDSSYNILSNNDPYLFRYNFTAIGVSITTDTFGGDRLDNLKDLPSGNTGAIAIGKLLSVSPTNIGSIQLSAEDFGFFLSRSYTGTPCHIDIEVAGSSPLRVMTGVVGTIQADGTSIGIEIVADLEKLKADVSPYTTQSNCMWSLGVDKCTVDPQIQVVQVLSVLGKEITLKPPGLAIALNTQFSWECYIGNDGYFVSAATSTTSKIMVDRDILGLMRSITLRRFCNRSYENCGVYNNRHQFSGNPFLNTSSLNYVL